MSVISSPQELADRFEIATMQEMTSAVCDGVIIGTTAQLKRCS